MMQELKHEVARIVQYREEAEPAKIEATPFVPARRARPLVAVDGSYAFLWSGSGVSLAVVRIGSLHYAAEEDGYRKLHLDQKDHAVVVSSREEVMAEQGPILSSLYESTLGSRDQPREIVNEYRRYLEASLALEVARRERGSILAMDGTLEIFPRELDHSPQLQEACHRNDHYLVGVSKDSILQAFGRKVSDEELLRGEPGPAYVRVPQEFEKKSRARFYGDIYFAKLHSAAAKWFRVDVGPGKAEVKEVFRHLSAYAQSPLYPGYPFPLLEAHRFAVTIRQFRNLYEEYVVKNLLQLGLPLPEALSGLTHYEGERRSTFHAYLDLLARDLK